MICRRKRKLIQARNQYVQAKLHGLYAQQTSGGKVEVFTISNIVYDKYTKSGNTEMVELSGIPALRAFCYTATAQRQWMKAIYFLKTTLAESLHSLEVLMSQAAQVATSKYKSNIDDMRQKRESAVDQLRLCLFKVSLIVKPSLVDLR